MHSRTQKVLPETEVLGTILENVYVHECFPGQWK